MASGNRHGIIVCGEASESEEEELCNPHPEDTKFVIGGGIGGISLQSPASTINKKDGKIGNPMLNSVKNPTNSNLAASSATYIVNSIYDSPNSSLHRCLVKDFHQPINNCSKKYMKLKENLVSAEHSLSSVASLSKRTMRNMDLINVKMKMLNNSNL